MYKISSLSECHNTESKVSVRNNQSMNDKYLRPEATKTSNINYPFHYSSAIKLKLSALKLNIQICPSKLVISLPFFLR